MAQSRRNDTFKVNNFDGSDFFDGGSGTDSLILNPIDDRDLTINAVKGSVSDDEPGAQRFKNIEVIEVGNGDDNFIGSFRDETFNGGAGKDTLTGDGGKDTPRGGAGDDILTGDGGKDTPRGGAGDDILTGGTGADILRGGAGNDILTGGTGTDHFAFNFLSEGIDTIEDFSIAQEDRILINPSFGASNSNQFTFDSSNGALCFEGQQFATVNVDGGFDLTRDLVIE